MAAPDLETLLDFETNVESAAKTFLQTATGLSASSAFASLDQDDLILPRISVMFEMGEALDPTDQKTTGSGELEYRKYAGTLNIQIVTDASIDGTPTNHRSIRAKARSAMLLNADNFTTQTGNIVVSGAGTDDVDADYLPISFQNGKQAYIKKNASFQDERIEWNGSEWEIFFEDFPNSVSYFSTDDVATPDLVTTWQVGTNGEAPIPTVTAETILPYYDVNYMRPTGTTFEQDGDLAISTLSYAINVVIRNDAWPT